ncbi:MAG: RNA polymerase sigma factor [Planctomycetota bacterium]|nr:RNA polymerase sigma factor [Planctomycetota bacterium]
MEGLSRTVGDDSAVPARGEGRPAQLGGQRAPNWRRLEDEVLLRALVEGHREAFDEFYSRHSEKVLSFLARLVAGRLDPEDLLQEAFLRVITHAKDFRKGSPVRPWLFTIARNAAFNALRNSKRRGELEVQTDLSDWNPPQFSPETQDPSEKAAEKEDRARVLKALDDLPPLHREIIVLTLFDGFTYEEASQITGDPESTLRSRVYYGLRKLRDRLKERP